MDERDAELADELDRYWDALVRGGRPSAPPAIAELAGEIRRLHARLAAPVSETRVWHPPMALRSEVPPALLPSAHVAERRHRAVPQRRALSALATAALIALTVLSTLAVVRLAPAPANQSGAAVHLYLTNVDNQRLTPLDPTTLANLPGAKPMPAPFKLDASGDWILSADGSTFAGIELDETSCTVPAAQTTITIRDGLTGPVRARFHPPVPTAGIARLSADGRRLLAVPGAYCTIGLTPPLPPRAWDVFDTTTGRLVGQVTAARGPDPKAFDIALLSPDGQRFYLLTLGVPAGPAETRAPRLAVFDLASGAQIGGLILPDLGIGTIQSPFANAGLSVKISPNGKLLALVHVGGTAVTLVDLMQLTVEGTLPLPKPVSPVAIAPAGSYPPRVGNSWSVKFTPDGRGLYVVTSRFNVLPSGRACETDTLRRIDLDTGKVTAATSDMPWQGLIQQLWISSDGRDVYTFGPQPATGVCGFNYVPFLLRRLDATTLAVKAQRTIDDGDQVVIYPVT